MVDRSEAGMRGLNGGQLGGVEVFWLDLELDFVGRRFLGGILGMDD